ncbi:uncharacterized protein TNCV_4166771 [Trichonephila clavipes]|nr:uncharacterized protein TNCV_4166771 [Trichonephila clavipes]
MSLVSLNRQRGTCTQKKIAKCANFLNTSQLSKDENADFIVLNNKLSTVKEIIEEISQLKCAKCVYYNQPDETDLKDALDVTINLQAEAQELEVLQPSSEELTFEPIPRSVALASKRGISWGSEKGLLPTAVIYVNGHQGRLKFRYVLDLASESFLTLHAAERLGLDKIKTDCTVQDLVIPQGIVLADEGFNQPSEISCLIGSEHFFDIFGTKQIRVPNSNFRLIDSKFGYVVTGSYINEPCYFNGCFLSKGWNTLDKTLGSFWETENLSEEQPIISD